MVSSVNIIVEHRNPTVEEYLFLTASVGWSEYVSAETANTALRNSTFAVVAFDREAIVGTGRIVSDKALFFYIQDVLVVPDSQGPLISLLPKVLKAYLPKGDC